MGNRSGKYAIVISKVWSYSGWEPIGVFIEKETQKCLFVKHRFGEGAQERLHKDVHAVKAYDGVFQARVALAEMRARLRVDHVDDLRRQYRDEHDACRAAVRKFIENGWTYDD